MMWAEKACTAMLVPVLIDVCCETWTRGCGQGLRVPARLLCASMAAREGRGSQCPSSGATHLRATHRSIACMYIRLSPQIRGHSSNCSRIAMHRRHRGWCRQH